MIDEDRTMQLYGYKSCELKPKSTKFIVCVCNICGKYRIITKQSYRDICQSCANKRPCKLPIPKYVSDSDRFIPNTGIDRIKTIKRFRYDPLDLKKNSDRRIIAKCQKCGKIREITFRYYRDLCPSCVIKGENHPNWQGGITDQRYCNLWTESFRESIRERFHNKCFLCGKTKINNSNRKLSVHHVNYNKNCLCGLNCEFVPLCVKCHIKTNYNRQYWENLIMCYLYPNKYFMVDL